MVFTAHILALGLAVDSQFGIGTDIEARSLVTVYQWFWVSPLGFGSRGLILEHAAGFWNSRLDFRIRNYILEFTSRDSQRRFRS